MSRSWNTAKLSSLLTGLLVAGCATGSPASTPAPTASSGPGTVAPSASAADTTPGPVTDTLTGGRYVFEAEGLTIVATGPDGWVGYPSWAMDGPEPLRADSPDGIGITFTSARGLFSDPCHWDVAGIGQADQPGDVAVGPTVDDLVAALRANSFYSSSAATPVTIDGYAGQELELRLPEEPDYATCDKDDPDDSGGHVFVFAGSGLYVQGQANIWHLYILDVEGTRLITVIMSYAGTPQADLDTAQNVIDTMDIRP